MRIKFKLTLALALISLSMSSFVQKASNRLVTGEVKDEAGVLQKDITVTEKDTKN